MLMKRITFAVILIILLGLCYTAFAQDPNPTNEPTVDELIATLRAETDILWTAIAAFLVFFMQAGFSLVEAGFTRAKNASNIIMKNLMDFSLGAIFFWIIGASIMFGENNSGLFGSIDLGLGDWLGNDENPNRYSYLIFQTVFAATAATIVSGAMAERTKFRAYLVYSVFVTALIYPIFGSWAWNGLWADEATGYGTGGWLESFTIGEASGFIDFAGSTVVHSIGAWIGLAGAIILGPRRGKYTPDGKVRPIPGHSLTLAGLGVFILWLGWFGFNPGSTVVVEGAGGFGGLAHIAVNTNIAAAAGAIGSLITGWIIIKKPDVGITLNGALAGLVAITAGCADATPWTAALIGLTAGIIVYLSVLFFDKLKIDDPVGAISVHGTCGAWGTLMIGLLAVDKGSINQFLIQLIGVLAAFALAFGLGLILFFLIKKTIGLRVDEQEEIDGLDLHEHGAEAYPDFRIAQR